MPRYFFNVFDGRDYRDTEGTVFLDSQTAQTHAIRYAGECLADHAKRLALGEDWRMEVTDDQGLILFRLDFHVTAAPVMRQDGLPT